MSFKFEMLKEQSAIIKVIGVGGGGGNAVNHMYKQGISGVDFIVCNTDAQALELSPIPNKVQLGASLTEGMGAGADPMVGENSAIESIEDIKRMLGSNTKMLFITAGMGGGTGTGASPVLAKAAKELGILTVAIVTTPFAFEGKRRRVQAEEGLGELQKYVDSYLVISNDRLRDIFGNLTMTAAFAKADDILTTAAKGIAEIITIPGYVNVDFKDVRTVMNDSGVAIMGNAIAEGEQRALRAVEGALASPLLKDNEIEGARYILLNITSGKQEVTMDEVTVITDYIQEKAGLSADLIWGNCINESLENELSVTIIATGFQTSEERKKEKENERIEIPLTPEEPKAPYVRPINQFVQKEKSVADAEPVTVVKPATEEPSIRPVAQQADLFSAPSSSKPQLRNTTPDNDGIIRHTLTPQEAQQQPQEDRAEDGFEVKVTASPFHFELPAAGSEIRQEEKEPEEVEKVGNTSDHRTPEEVEKELLTVKDRIFRLKQLSLKLKSANGLQELETEPAYRRKQLALDDVPHSSESQVSRFTLSTEEGITEIRPNNSFLHDNVD
ncbi:cell division protein FtsZ [Parapedobacter koreensis]|uniref:Cell division protein FtsZ n=1 Tax=Parapedobacter koreensis TaxID=332977 RepID=A0A1H7PDT7_9SPHI|nr:cell division protein FtsZ [Parapedobacter koreensis]SEL33247.1 cell division protein FtsZ [Parapedobacter koreensis]